MVIPQEELRPETFEVLHQLGLVHLVCHIEMNTIQAAFFAEEDAKGWLDGFVSRSGRVRYCWLLKEADGVVRRYIFAY